MIAAIYGRVSTEKQDYAGQVEELREYAGRAGWEVTEYLEKESAKTGSERPVLAKLFKDARLKKFNVVLVWKIDRFGRSLMEFIENLQVLDQLDIRFVACSQGIDTDKRNPFSKLLMNLLAMFAEFELDIIHERTFAGQVRYRMLYEKGKVGVNRERQSRSGRNLPVGRPKNVFHRRRAVEMRQQGRSWQEIATALNVPKTTIRRAFRQEEPAIPPTVRS